jgi:hypothetical protein
MPVIRVSAVSIPIVFIDMQAVQGFVKGRPRGAITIRHIMTHPLIGVAERVTLTPF